MEKKLLMVLLAATMCFVTPGCKDSPPGPPPPATGPDTTSHNVAWQIDTLGDGASSILHDVAIVNDTLAFAVGEIYKRDSTGQFDQQAYNLAKWDGRAWQLVRIQFHTFCNQPYTSSYPARSIIAFSGSDILVASGAEIVSWNGVSQTSVLCIPEGTVGSFTQLWGSNSRSFYAVGRNGTIVYFTNGWQTIASGTSADITDVWGVIEHTSGRRTILVTASNRYSNSERKLLSIDSSNRVDSIPWAPGARLNTVWFTSDTRVFVGGGGIYVGTPAAWQEIFDLPSFFSTRIRGTAPNDLVVVGAFGLCGHFNGQTWKSYPEVALSNGSYEGLAVSKKLIIAVGQIGDRAVVLRGNR
jgi:hypothetical protein